MRDVRCPGFFDLQVNGFAGVDFNDPRTTADDVLRAIAALQATGVTRFLPALITSSLESFAACARTLLSVRHPAIAGLHMEGPYLSAEARGVHPEHWLVRAALDDFERRQDAAGGAIALVTLAPEVPGAITLTAALRDRGVCVAIGHTAAAPEVIRAAVNAGATVSTHLGNGGPRTPMRAPNHVWEQLAADGLAASLIVDGHHLTPAAVKAMVRAKTPARVVLVSDATAAAGAVPGPVRLGDVDAVLSSDGRVTERGSNRLAGSALCMPVAVANVVRFARVTLDEALAMAHVQPARLVRQQPAGQVEAAFDEATGDLHIVNVSV